MKVFLTSVLALFFAAAFPVSEASPTNDETYKEGHKRHGCLSDRAAHKIVHGWTSINEGQINLLDRTVTNDLTVEDEQVNFLFGLPPGPWAVGKEAYRKLLELALAPNFVQNVNIKPLLMVHDCDTISYRWQYTAESTGLNPNSTAKAGDPIAFKGIDILQIKKGTKLVKKVFTSGDYLWYLYYAGIKICFQKDALNPVCSD